MYTHRGSPAVLELTVGPVPEPGAGEVRVRVRGRGRGRMIVAGMNPTYVDARKGSGSLAHPQVPGQDGAGGKVLIMIAPADPSDARLMGATAAASGSAADAVDLFLARYLTDSGRSRSAVGVS